MPRLVVNPGSPAAWEIQLKPGDNFIGRGFSNDFKLTDPSVSGSHCQISVSDGTAVIRDLGSTNGTFVNRAPVQEAALKAGQTVHLGGVEMVFYADGPAGATTTDTAPPVRMVGAPVRATAAPVAARAARTTTSLPPPVAVPPPAPPLPAAAPHGGQCKYHPKTVGRFSCAQCQACYCELCVNTRTVGGVPTKFCRHCGTEVVPVQVSVSRPVTQGFFKRLPGIFVYPFRGSGLLVLIVSTLVFTALDFLGGGFYLIFRILAIGYLFAYMQNIIHATANQEEEMPDLPGMDGVFGACFRLVGAVVMSFGLAIGVMIYAFMQEETAAMIAVIPALLFGCFYFPMALLAVAMKDSVAAANPLVVVPAILKVPGAYLVTVILMAGVVGARFAGAIVMTVMTGGAVMTHDMSVLLMGFAFRALWSFVVVYLLTINMRLLGILYVTKRDRLGWFSR